MYKIIFFCLLLRKINFNIAQYTALYEIISDKMKLYYFNGTYTALYEIVSDKMKFYYFNGKDTSLPNKNLCKLSDSLLGDSIISICHL